MQKIPGHANRELPAGRISLSEVWAIILVSYFFLFYSAYKLNPLCLLLAPIIPVTSIIYPYLKRSLPISHFVLGMNLGYAPVGGWLAVTGIFNYPIWHTRDCDAAASVRGYFLGGGI